MELINLLEVNSPFGYRQFRLLQGDIADINFPVDLLCVSAFRGCYLPVPNTLLGSLYKKRNIDLMSLSKVPTVDYRETFGTFFINSINDNSIKSLLCIEMRGNNKTIDEIFDDLLITLYSLEVKGFRSKSIMLPLIGTGNQQIPLHVLMGSLLKKVEYLLETSSVVEQVYLVSFKSEDSKVLNKTMNAILKRTNSLLPRSEIIESISKETTSLIRRNNKLSEIPCFQSLLKLLNKPEIQLFEIAISCRKICEHILNNILTDGSSFDLANKINRLRGLKVAPWVVGYFHILRVFGNEYAHDQSMNIRNPQNMNNQDLGIAMFALERIIEFYVCYEAEPV